MPELKPAIMVDCVPIQQIGDEVLASSPVEDDKHPGQSDGLPFKIGLIDAETYQIPMVVRQPIESCRAVGQQAVFLMQINPFHARSFVAQPEALGGRCLPDDRVGLVWADPHGNPKTSISIKGNTTQALRVYNG